MLDLPDRASLSIRGKRRSRHMTELLLEVSNRMAMSQH